MSKLAKIPIELKESVSADFEGSNIKISGPKGSLVFKIPDGVMVEKTNHRLQVKAQDKKDETKSALLGLTRAKLANMATGVYSGFEKNLELVGVGYRAAVIDNVLSLTVGFSHPVKVSAPEGITIKVSENIITISGIDKDLVGDIAAKIRDIKSPEPYKGKGIKYSGEKIRRKVGKAVKALGAK